VIDKIDLAPTFQLMNQGEYYEYLFGSMVKFIINEDEDDFVSVNLGLYMRYNDAGIAMLGMDYKRFSLGISYDINYSDLQTASGLRGGFEFSVIYMFGKNRKKGVRKMYCPIF